MRQLQQGLILLALLVTQTVQSQIFEYRGSSPFGLELTKPDTSEPGMRFIFFDIDNDGDKDAIIAGIDSIDQSQQPFTFKSIKFFVAVQKNVGNRWAPAFEGRQAAYSDLLQMTGLVYPAVADFNGDRLPDFVVCCDADEYLNLSVRYFESKSDGGYKSYSGEQLKLNDFSAGSFFVPEIADMDQDGDQDIVMSGFVRYFGDNGEEKDVATMLYAKNIGTASVPHFQGWYQNTNGIAAFLNKAAFFITGDLDLDEDVDLFTLWQDSLDEDVLFIGGIVNEPLVNGKANFVSGMSFLGLPAAVDDAASIPALADMDGDRDLDVFLLENLLTDTMQLAYYENISCTGQIDNKVIKTGTVLKANAIGMSYQWIDCQTGKTIEGATQQSYVPTTSGRYAVRLRDNKGCENLSPCEEVVISGTGDQTEANIDLGPTPAKDHVWIRHRDGSIIDQIVIYGEDGKMVMNKQNTSSSVRLDLTSWSAGVYLTEIKIGTSKVHKKIIVVP